MCKHQHTTPVIATLDNGSPVAIHQCDMCGMTVPALSVDLPNDEVLSLPGVDSTALQTELTRRWRSVLARPVNGSTAILQPTKTYQREEDGDILWA